MQLSAHAARYVNYLPTDLLKISAYITLCKLFKLLGYALQCESVSLASG